jgi:putative transposase
VVTPGATPQAQTPLKKQMVSFLHAEFQVSERRACRVLGFWRSTQRHHSPKKEEDRVLVDRLRVLAQERPRFGYRRLHTLLRREGTAVNHKCVYRLYRAEGLAVRQKGRKKLTRAQRVQKPEVSAPNQRWSMDFVSDQLASGQRFRVFNVVDDFTRENLVMHVGTSITGADVVRRLAEVVAVRGCPASINTDNGPEFISKVLDQWTHELGIVHIFIPPGRPVENAYIESFNGRVRDECLNLHWFQSLSEARLVIAAWGEDYNQVRPHSSLNGQSPNAFARLIQAG